MIKEILTDACFTDYIEIASSNVSESTVGEVTTGTITDDLGNSFVCEAGTKLFCRDTLKWYSSNGDGTALLLFAMS